MQDEVHTQQKQPFRKIRIKLEEIRARLKRQKPEMDSAVVKAIDPIQFRRNVIIVQKRKQIFGQETGKNIVKEG